MRCVSVMSPSLFNDFCSTTYNRQFLIFPDMSETQALLGFERNLTHLDGHTVTLRREGVTQPGFVQTIPGEGMPVFQDNAFGDLFVEYIVVLPTEINAGLRKRKFLAFSLPSLVTRALQECGVIWISSSDDLF